ncbi:NlpC/P60 family protein [Desulfosediminicola sp.]|uniref:C40 family peptidase n=1 Tax=Desulfosediminicola sp. TaxID=2886825 RepID=UPI003AF2FA2C
MIQAVIQVSVSNHYKQPDYCSEIVSQGLLWERVELLEEEAEFCRIRQRDGYQSWVSSRQLAQSGMEKAQGLEWRLVRSHNERIFSAPDRASTALRDVVIGSRLPVLAEERRWAQVVLPGGETGWLESCHFGEIGPAGTASIVSLAREFLGYQYSWGGRTPKGFDCSGFVQTVFGLHGIELPRDANMQQKLNLVSKDHHKASAGDLLFFGESPDRVTHVAISLGDNRFIHAYGMVRENSFSAEDSDFSPKHLESFVSVNRYPLG